MKFKERNRLSSRQAKKTIHLNFRGLEKRSIYIYNIGIFRSISLIFAAQLIRIPSEIDSGARRNGGETRPVRFVPFSRSEIREKARRRIARARILGNFYKILIPNGEIRSSVYTVVFLHLLFSRYHPRF